MDEPVTAPKLGTFLGVYTPTILTILGIMLYLRIGWVVGNAGLVGALTIIVIANTITLLTALSMSSLATSMRVGVGGAYYLISRTLGLEFGGAIGIPLYLSQTLSITLYAYGLGESFGAVVPGIPPTAVKVVAVVTVIAVTLLAAKSTQLTLKAQLPIMGLIVASLVSLFLGVDWGPVRADLVGHYADPEVKGFWATFAVFFPAVTGVLAGVSLSGDLEDPGRSIPRGALLAVGTGFVIYVAVPIALAIAAPTDVLVTNKLVWLSVAAVPFLVMPGLWGAILSSAFGSILGAPRTLQALAIDGLAPGRLADNDEKTGEPLLGLRLSGAIALVAAILLPDLNAVAEWVTVFFLTTYGALNLVACLEALVRDPGFRPTIPVPWAASALGAIGCFVAMFLINPEACLVALLVEGALFLVLSRRSLQSTGGDVRTGLWLAAIRFGLLKLRTARRDPRNWRPLLLVFTDRLERHLAMARLADQLGQHRGIVTITELVPGPLDPDRIRGRVAENQARVDDAALTAFCEVVVVKTLETGMLVAAQANGFAGLESNTIMVGYPDDGIPGLVRQLGSLRTLAGIGKCVLVHKPGEWRPQHDRPRIDVWWKGREHNGDLMLLLAHLLRSSAEWRRAAIVLKSLVADSEEAARRRAEFDALLPEIRIDAGVDVVVGDGEAAREVIQGGSRDADLVLLGLAMPEPGEEGPRAVEIDALVRGLPEVLLVYNAGPFRGRLV